MPDSVVECLSSDTLWIDAADMAYWTYDPKREPFNLYADTLQAYSGFLPPPSFSVDTLRVNGAFFPPPSSGPDMGHLCLLGVLVCLTAALVLAAFLHREINDPIRTMMRNEYMARMRQTHIDMARADEDNRTVPTPKGGAR